MRYRLPADKLVNQLVPHFLSGRKHVLFLQSLVYPLKTLNDRFVMFAKEKQIEASMTSQVMYFEWYLNHKFGKYLVDSGETIYLEESGNAGVPLYHEAAAYGKPFTLWYENESVTIAGEEGKNKGFYFQSEEKAVNKAGFMVCVPEITISQKEFVHMLSYEVNRYKLAGKTCLIKIDAKEITPDKKI